MQLQATKLPIISPAENGDNTQYYRRAMFDSYGNQIATQDERGYITTYQFDPLLGVMTQMVQDDAVPSGSGWTANSGTRLKLTTNYEYDDQARVTQTLGPTFNVNGQSVRTANWAVYQDAIEEVWTAQGYAVGADSGPDYNYTLVNPVSINRMDEAGRTIDSIQAVRLPPQPSSIDGSPVDQAALPSPWLPSPAPCVESPGRLSASDSFPQSTWIRWSHTEYNDQQQTTSSRIYFAIPPCGPGCAGVNYNEMTYGYDVMNRQNRQVAPGGTISRSVFDVRNLLLSNWVGTNDTYATDAQPDAGGSHPGGNNMVILTGNVYDGGLGNGDGNLTQRTDYVDITGSLDRITTFEYDFRDRQTQINNPIDNYTVNVYDNLNRVIEVDRHALSGGTLIGKSQTLYDDRGRVYQTLTYAVYPTSASTLTSNTWYDPAGNVAKSLPVGSQAYTKNVYDSIGRLAAAYTGYAPAGDSTPFTVSSTDKIFEQSVPTYDGASNTILTASFQRNQGDTTTAGPLVDTNARMSYVASWYDGIGRQIASANYGTNGDGSTPSLPDAPPPSSADVLVSQTLYNERGEAYLSIDPAGKVSRADSDDAGRTIRTTDNYVPPGPCLTCGNTGPCGCLSPPSSASQEGCPQPGNDQNIIVEMSYNADSQMLTLTAKNPVTGDQTTRYQYGTTIADSAVVRNDLRVAEIYPDAADSTDRVTYAYNRQSQPTSKTDQNGSVHDYNYDLLGRQIQDIVMTLGANVEGSVRRIDTAYEVRGMVTLVTSYANTVGTTVVNQLTLDYNSYQQLISEQQDQSASSGPNLTVSYAYEDGSANTIRPTGITYPYSSLALVYGYATGDDDALSRISSVSFNGVTVAAYKYFGMGSVAETDYNIAATINSTLASGSSYPGFDLFGRVVNLPWTKSTTGDLAQLEYGYDLASNRTYRHDLKAATGFDELYSYDGLHRLTATARGTLTSGAAPITTPTLQQGWQLDATGNWTGFNSFDQGTALNTLVQQRVSNTSNEITGIAATVGSAWQTPAYDRNGNMTTMPQPLAPTSGYTGVWDAWNRLIALKSGANDVESCLYDGMNRRVKRVLYTSGSPTETAVSLSTATNGRCWKNT